MTTYFDVGLYISFSWLLDLAHNGLVQLLRVCMYVVFIVSALNLATPSLPPSPEERELNESLLLVMLKYLVGPSFGVIRVGVDLGVIRVGVRCLSMRV